MKTELKTISHRLASVRGSEARKAARECLIRAVSAKNDDGTSKDPCDWQDQPTPHDIAREMCELVAGKADGYVVLFSLEMLESLVFDFRISPEKIVFIGDRKVENGIASYYGVHTELLSKETSWNKTALKDALKNTLRQGIQAMKFDKLAVVMNPPYQLSTGGHGRDAKPIYNVFIETVIDELQPDYLVSINPSRWMIGGKSELDRFRSRMISDRRLKIIADFPGLRDIFPSVEITGGVNYFLWDKSHNGPCTFNGVDRYLDEEDTIIRENEARPILKKIKSKTNKWVSECASPSKPYGLRGNAPTSTAGVPCWFKQSIGLAKVNPNTVSNPRNDLDTWRVLAPQALPHGGLTFIRDGKYFERQSIVVAAPGEACTETFIVLKSFKTKAEAENFITYIYTRFFRFVLRMRTVSQHITRDCYSWVPDLDCSKPWTDKELFKQFGLSRQEQAYIERKIKVQSK